MEIPKIDVIGEHIAFFDKQEKYKENVLKTCFGKIDTFEDVLVQVFMLNSLYGTCIDPEGLHKAAESIYSENSIRIILDSADTDVDQKSDIVEKIAGFGERHTISFASKYCSWICEANCGEV